jgi:hypothetical protein
MVEFGRNLTSVAVAMCSHLIYFIEIFYKCAFNAVCTDSAAVNCIAKYGCLLTCCAVKFWYKLTDVSEVLPHSYSMYP